MTAPTHFSRHASRLATGARAHIENVVYFESIDSTQACALRLIEQAENEEIVLPATLVISRSQTVGRGRFDRTWISPVGGLYCSWVASKVESASVARLPMIAAAAAAAAVRNLGVENVGVKWPNDLLVDGRKVAGLLIHARHGSVTWVAVGLGVNIDLTPEIPGGASPEPTSLAEHLEGVSTTELIERLVPDFVGGLAAGIDAPQESVETWRTLLVHRPGDEMAVRRGDGTETRGRFAGLTAAGHLRLECAGGEQIVSSGDVVE